MITSIVHQADSTTVQFIADAIITDPVYDAMPDVDTLLKRCKGNVIVFCDPLKRPTKVPDEILFWIKTPSTKNTSKRCSRFVEEIMVYRQGETFNPLHWSCMTGVFTDTVIQQPIHPWEKPASLIEKLIAIYTNPGDLVIDPYCGSGTTGVACMRQGRSFEGYEFNPEWVDVCEKRGLKVERP